MSGFSKQDYELINLGVCIKQQAERLGIEHEGVPLEGVVVRIAERALSVVAEEPEWGVWDRRDRVFRHVEPPTEENARREAALGRSEFEATRVLPWVPVKQEDQTTNHENRGHS